MACFLTFFFISGNNLFSLRTNSPVKNKLSYFYRICYLWELALYGNMYGNIFMNFGITVLVVPLKILLVKGLGTALMGKFLYI